MSIHDCLKIFLSLFCTALASPKSELQCKGAPPALAAFTGFLLFRPLLIIHLRFTFCSSLTSYSLRNKMSARSLTSQLLVSRRISDVSLESHPPVFLAPLLASISLPSRQRSSFSTTAALSVRANKKRDGNPHRGESALRRTGLRYPNGMSRQPLPQPVLDPKKRKIQVDSKHGLWGFFNEKGEALSTPKEDSRRGMLRSSSSI